MTLSLDNAVVYDIEVFPNLFTLSMECLNNDTTAVWEISPWRDDRATFFQWIEWLRATQTPMIGFNSEFYDYSLLHWLVQNPQATNDEIKAKSDAIIKSDNRFAHSTWPSERFAPQIDVFKINHFDNKAKTTSLKALQVNMRSQSVMDSPLPFDKPVMQQDVASVIHYNQHDVSETKKFALMNMPAIEFRIGLMPQFGVDVMNYNDTKIGEKMLEQRLGDDVCYNRVPIIGRDGAPWIDYNTGLPKTKKQKKQTPRSRIALAEVIFPYVTFNNPEFQRVLEYMKAQVLTPDDIEDPEAQIKTKGVFTGLSANVGGVSFEFGTGGIHASVTNQRFQAGGGWIIRDIDVASLYPSIAIKNHLSPAHLGEAFVTEYAKLPAERKDWQKLKGKKCVEANSIKLAGNGAYGKTNSKFSFLYDPQYTMTVTINGQLILCMLAEWLVTVPTLSIIQVNTDGITYYINEQYEPEAAAICRRWEAFTLLTLEAADYSRMWISDVNTYIAEGTDGSLKQKGRLWHPDPLNYAQSISECQPPAWHKDLGNVASIRAAVAAMLHGIDPETFIRSHSDPFDFMCRVRAPGTARLEIDGMPQQSTLRYYIARDGGALVKIAPPPAGSEIGQWKRAPRITKAEYDKRMAETGGEWCATVCTAARTTYQEVRSGIEAGWKVAECNDAETFDWGRVDYGYYIAEARKLIIA